MQLPEGEQSKERTVRVTGDRKQIERAREMIQEVMDQVGIRYQSCCLNHSCLVQQILLLIFECKA